MNIAVWSVAGARIHQLVQLLVVVSVALLVSACGPGARDVRHPLTDSLASAFYPDHLADAQLTPPGLDIRFVRDSLLATYGAQNLPEAHIIGRIGIAKLLGDDIFVLDDRLHTVHVLGVRGASHEQIGRPGQGPGELAIPRGLALSHDRLFVGDERRVIHEYLRAGGRWSWARDIPVPFLPLDICSIGDSLYVLAVTDDLSPIIHRVEQGELVTSFGVPYRSADMFIRYVTTEGQLVCLPEIDGIAWVPTRMDAVHMYRTDGTLRWIAQLPEYKPMGMIEDTTSRTVSMGLAGGRTEMHMLHAAAPVDSNLLVQVGLYDQQAVEEDTPRTIESYLIDLNSGVTRKIAFPYSGLIGVTDTRLALFSNDPWPRVDVFAVSEAR